MDGRTAIHPGHSTDTNFGLYSVRCVIYIGRATPTGKNAHLKGEEATPRSWHSILGGGVSGMGPCTREHAGTHAPAWSRRREQLTTDVTGTCTEVGARCRGQGCRGWCRTRRLV